MEGSGTSLKDKVDALVIHKMNEYNIPGLTIGLVVGDSLLDSRGYGVRDIDYANPITENTVFHTASISKLFTAQAVVRLVEKGQLSLDTPVIDIVPTLNYQEQRVAAITVRSLLNHTSGLPDVS